MATGPWNWGTESWLSGSVEEVEVVRAEEVDVLVEVVVLDEDEEDETEEEVEEPRLLEELLVETDSPAASIEVLVIVSVVVDVRVLCDVTVEVVGEVTVVVETTVLVDVVGGSV